MQNIKNNHPLEIDKNRIYHILNGDSLAQQLAFTKVKGESIICRESLIVGPVFPKDETLFWEVRSAYFNNNYGVTAHEYGRKSIKEFEKIKNIPPGSDVCLWFEHDLFCQVNMWYVILYLSKIPNLRIYRISPVIRDNKDVWLGFGPSSGDDLEKAFLQKTEIYEADINLAIDLWNAYSKSDLSLLKSLSFSNSTCFVYLEEVCQAHIDRYPEDDKPNRPEKSLLEIIKSKPANFGQLFSAFSSKEGIYGFGDTQIKGMLAKLGINTYDNY